MRHRIAIATCRVVELELTEPSVYLRHDSGAADRFAAALAAELDRPHD